MASMNKHESKHEQTNGKPELSPAELRGRLETIVRELAGLVGQLNGHQGIAAPEVSMNGTGDRMLTVDEVATRLGISRAYAYHQAKDWPFRVKLGHRTLRFSEAGLERWCAEHANPAVEENG